MHRYRYRYRYIILGSKVGKPADADMCGHVLLSEMVLESPPLDYVINSFITLLCIQSSFADEEWI